MSDVAQWLEDLGLGQYSSAFAENGVDFRSLPHLTEQDLKDLGVLLGHRRVLLTANQWGSEVDIGPRLGEPTRAICRILGMCEQPG